MRQELFRIPGLDLPIFGFGMMLVVALFGAIRLAAWRARRSKLDPEIIDDLAFWIVVCGLLGARVFYVVEYWGTRIRTFWDIFKVWEGGIVFYGCILGGTVAFFAYWAIRRFPFLAVADAVAPSVALGLAFGRIGCFLNGCCYGDACTLPWAVRFPRGTAPWFDQLQHGLIDPAALRSLPIHPTQLYSALDGLILLVLLSAYYPLRRRDGEVFGLLLVTYPITRFLVERLRNDEGAVVLGLTISQAVSVGVLLVGVLYWLWLSRRPAVRYADTAPESSPAAEPAGAPA